LSLASSLPTIPRDQLDAVILDHLRHRLAALLGLTRAEVVPAEPLGMLGIDSIRVSELAFLVEEELGVKVPLDAFLADPTLEELAGEIAGRVGSKGWDAIATVQAQLDGLDGMSEAEIDALLQAEARG
jgi:acyl carrier protein